MKFLLGGVAAVVAMALGCLVVVETGMFDADASAPHAAFTAWATHTSMIRSVQVRSRAVTAPVRFAQEQVRAGFHAYVMDCAMCHGGPAVPRQAWVQGMNPTPPYLLDAARRWKAAQLYWIIKKGVKMTGMPAWGDLRSDAEIWNLVAFLEALPDLSPDAYAQMKAADAR